MGKLREADINAWVKAGKPIAGRSDGNGLTFTLWSNGVASWVLRYRFAGRMREPTLSRYPERSLEEARKLARRERVLADEGIDAAHIFFYGDGQFDLTDFLNPLVVNASQDGIGGTYTLTDARSHDQCFCPMNRAVRCYLCLSALTNPGFLSKLSTASIKESLSADSGQTRPLFRPMSGRRSD